MAADRTCCAMLVTAVALTGAGFGFGFTHFIKANRFAGTDPGLPAAACVDADVVEDTAAADGDAA